MAGGDRSTRTTVGPQRPSGAAHRTERLMCLVFIIKARGRRGITRAELRRAVDDYANCASDEAYERMLERDKRDLRDAGVIIDVVQRDNWHEDEHAYVLGSESLLTLPGLDADELRMLALAAEAWDKGTWHAMARGALHKLEVFGDDLALALAPRMTVRADAQLEPLRTAIRHHHAVSFEYRRPGDAVPARRHIEPWGLLSKFGGWYCVGYDLDREATRVFRTSRMVGALTTSGPATQPAQADWATLVHAGSTANDTTMATLLVQIGRGLAWRTRADPLGQQALDGTTYDVLRVPVSERAGGIGALAAAAPTVLVVEPADLRERVRAHLGEPGHG